MVKAQTQYLDSISALIRDAKTDTLKILLINLKTERLKEVNLDSALKLGEENLKAARDLKFQNGELNILTNLSGIYTTKGDYQSAESVLKRADSLARTLKNDRQIARVYSSLGILYGTQGKYDSSNVYFRKLVPIHENNGDSISLGRTYSNLAIGYQMQSNYPQTLIYQQKALGIQEAINNEVSQSYLLMNMGVTYQLMQDNLKSENYFLKGIGLANKNQIKNVALYGYSNLSSLYANQNKWAKSYDNASLASKLAEEMGDEGIQAASMAKAAKALLNLNQIEEAEELATKAIVIAEKAGQPLVLYQTNGHKGEILTFDKRYKAAIPYLEKSVKIIEELDNYDINIAETYANLSLCYEKTGKYDKALFSYKSSAKIKDSVRARENIQKATELSMTYDFEKKESLNKAIQDKKDAQAERSKNRQLYLILGLGILLLCGIFIALILYKNNKQKQKANLLLVRQKLKVEKTLKELKITQTQLIQSEKMASLGELTAGIAHEIQNPLNFVSNFSEVSNELILEIQEERVKQKDERNEELVGDILNDIKSNLEKIVYHGKRADTIVKGMLQHSRSSGGIKEPTDINKIVDEYLRLAYNGLRAKDKNFNATLETDYDESIGKISVIPQDIGRVILNMVNNAFYAATLPPEGRFKDPNHLHKPIVIVSTKQTKDAVLISVKDNGPGVPKNILEKIFQPFFTTKPSGKGTGLGLSMSYDIVKAHGGKIDVISKDNEGSEFIIKLPI